MKLSKIHLVLLLMLIFAVHLLPAQVVLNQPAAVVNLIRSEMITVDELEGKLESYKAARIQAGSSTEGITEEYVLEIMINDLLVLQGAERDGVTLSDQDLDTLVNKQRASVSQQLGTNLNDAQFEQVLNSYFGLTLAEYRAKIYENYIVDAYISQAKSDILDSAKAPTKQEIESYYKKNAASFINPEYIKVSHIFISKAGRTDEQAKALTEKIGRNILYGVKSFDDQIIEYSDDENSKFIGGTLGWIAINDATKKAILGEQFFDVAFALEEGEISKVVKSNSGYHIVKLIERKAPKILQLGDTLSPSNSMTVNQYITQKLYTDNQDAAYKAAISSLVADLRDEAEITILLGQN